MMVKNVRTNKRHRPAAAKRRGLPLAGLFAGAALIAAVSIYTYSSSRSSVSEVTDGSAYVRRETKDTLSPALFVGKVETAYRVAQDIPDVLDHLYCYCQCDKHSGHKSLRSCYTDNHAANCDVCVNEAMDAAKMMKQGYELKEIRRQIDRKYSRT
jgi:hypothetical protein